MKHRLSYSSVVATLALLLAVGGTAAAGAQALLTGTNVKDESLTGADIQNDSLTGADIRAGSLGSNAFSAVARANLRGATGPAGRQGREGRDGIAGARRRRRHVDGRERRRRRETTRMAHRSPPGTMPDDRRLRDLRPPDRAQHRRARRQPQLRSLQQRPAVRRRRRLCHCRQHRQRHRRRRDLADPPPRTSRCRARPTASRPSTSRTSRCASTTSVRTCAPQRWPTHAGVRHARCVPDPSVQRGAQLPQKRVGEAASGRRAPVAGRLRG